jgi:hypothetical protein
MQTPKLKTVKKPGMVNKGAKKLIRRSFWKILNAKHTGFSQVVDTFLACAANHNSPRERNYVQWFGEGAQDVMNYYWLRSINGAQKLSPTMACTLSRAERWLFRRAGEAAWDYAKGQLERAHRVNQTVE